MSTISFMSPGQSAASGWQVASLVKTFATNAAQAAPSTIAPESDALTAPLDTTIASSVSESLLSLQGRLDAPIAESNALATAAGAITEIGSAISTIRNVLGQWNGSNQATSDSTGTDSQSTIDAALDSIDSISSSSQFLGRSLLDGTYSSAGQTIPALSVQTLGAVDANGAKVTLDTLSNGGVNDLTSGNRVIATTIAAAAARQIGSVAQLVDSLHAVATGTALLGVEAGPAGIDSDCTPGLNAAMALAQQVATIMIADPSQSSAATANSPADHVLAML